MIGQVDFDEAYEEAISSTPEYHLDSLKEHFDTLQGKLAEAQFEIRELNNAIVLLKDYIVSNGLKPFWTTEGSGKPISEMTPEELRVRNQEVAKRIKPSAKSHEALPQPSTEDLTKLYEAKVNEDGAINSLARFIISGNAYKKKETENEEE